MQVPFFGSTMRWLVLCGLVYLSLMVFSAKASAADFDAGTDAYLRSDYATAVIEWRPLAEDGNALAQFFLGLLYQDGLGVPQSFETSAHWYRRAAEQGYAHAQYILAENYKQGRTGSPYDFNMAMKWYLKAAENGHIAAQQIVASYYSVGQNFAGFDPETPVGVPQNGKNAVMWLKRSADNARSQYELGQLFFRGVDENVPRNPVEAYKWFSLAAENGRSTITVDNNGSTTWQDRIARELTPEQLENAKKLTAVCRESNYQDC